MIDTTIAIRVETAAETIREERTGMVDRREIETLLGRIGIAIRDEITNAMTPGGRGLMMIVDIN